MSTQQRKKTAKDWILHILLMNFAVLILSVGVYFFKTPNGFAIGGVSGLSIVLAIAFRAVSQATFMLVINVLLLIVGVLVLGKECGVQTIICSLLFSIETWLLERFLPLSGPLTDQPLLELTYAILLTGIASAILFQINASSGGTDIVALILKKYTRLDVGRALLVSDFLIASSTFFVVGIRSGVHAGVRAGLYALLGLFAKAFLVDSVIENINTCKSFLIVTTHPEEISEYILKTMHHGVTACPAEGEFTHEQKTLLITVCRRSEAFRLKKYARQVDPSSFVIVTSTSEIIGRGFRSV